jgi:hypothetical protein
MIWLSHQFSEVFFFPHENSEQRKRIVFSIVDDMRVAEYTVQKGMKVVACPEQSGVWAHDTSSLLIEPQYHHKEVPYMPGVAITLRVQCPIIL